MIRFGTSGWRAVIGDQFTFENVRRVTRAIASVVQADGGADRGLGVSPDTRFLSEAFAGEAAAVLVAAGVPARLSHQPVPTPVLAFAIRDGGLAGGINVTASHNPPQYNGLKFSTSDGAPAPPEVTRRIEAALADVSGEPAAPGGGQPEALEPRVPYLAHLEQLVRVEALRAARMRIAFDPRYGTSCGYLDRFLEGVGVDVIRLHDRRDPLFGGGTPDCDAAQLGDLAGAVKSGNARLGLATDGDGDRFGIVDADGTTVPANVVVALLADYLCRSRGWTQGIGRTVATTHLIDRVAERHGLQVHETPVGFKYFNPLLAAGEIFMGCEESAGMSVKGHVPEKDGILAGLLVAEMVAEEGPDLKTQTQALYRAVGRLVSSRRDRRFDPARRAELARRTASPPARLAGVPVARENTLDGSKWIREDGAWLLIRVSGTEPVVRIYAEAEDEATVEQLVQAGEDMLP